MSGRQSQTESFRISSEIRTYVLDGMKNVAGWKRRSFIKIDDVIITLCMLI